MRWEERCPVPEGIHEFIGLLDITLGGPDGLVGLFAALLSGAPYLEMQLSSKDSAKARKLLERARKAGLEDLDYNTMGSSLNDLSQLLKELRPTAKPITREATEAFGSTHRPQAPRHTDDYTAFAPNAGTAPTKKKSRSRTATARSTK